MINQVYQLVAPRQLSIKFEDIILSDNMLVIRPTYLAICAADQRYYTGNREPHMLKKKLPMALIHETTGQVVYDAKGEYAAGTNVVLIPNTPICSSPYIAENYLASSKFRASGFDGFMQEYVAMGRDRVVPCQNLCSEVAAVCELVSVAMHAIDTFAKNMHGYADTIGVWGDGNLGYLVALLLTKKFPHAKIVVFGIDPYKMSFFSFADQVYCVNGLTDGIMVDHAFECVGGQASELAIQQIIDIINPEGTVMMLGVSEMNIPIQTRMVLEKGLKFVGRSRSGRNDFVETVRCLEMHTDLQKHIRKIIMDIIPVRGIADMAHAFEEDLKHPFKTVMEWNV